jgi:hypothetical protein
LLATTLAINAETPRFRAPLDPFFILLMAGALARLGRTEPAPEGATLRKRVLRR